MPMQCPKCKSENSIYPIWVFAEIKHIRMLKCVMCGSYCDHQMIDNRFDFKSIRKAVEKRIRGKIKYK